MKTRPSDPRPLASCSLPTLAVISVVMALTGPAPDVPD